VTVSGTARLAFLPFRSPPGPFPAGIWTSQLTVIGDVSGGDVILTHEVILLTEPFSALMLTLEQVFIDDTQAADEYLMEIIGFEEHNPIGNNNMLIAFNTRNSLGTLSALGPADLLHKPIFLGRCDRTSGQGSSISVRSGNTDGISFRDSLWGYYWTPDAMYAPGGPQRPPGALFGN